MPLPSSLLPADHQVLLAALEQAIESNDFLSVLRLSARLSGLSTCADAPDRFLADVTHLDGGSTGSELAGLVTIETAASLRTTDAATFLVDRLEHGSPAHRRHAAWRLRAGEPRLDAVDTLLALVRAGGIETMHGHRTLRAWAVAEPDAIARRTVAVLDATPDPLERARLTDLLGRIEHPLRLDRLVRIASDEHESTSPRIAAIGALGVVRHERSAALLGALAQRDDEIAAHAALALDGLLVDDPTARRGSPGRLRIAQLVLAGSLDGQLSLGGRGDTGGVASLLVSLGEALGRRDDVEHVVTIGRGSPVDALTSADPATSGQSFGTVTVDESRGTGAVSWEHLPALERGIRRQLRLATPIDVLHLRMADVGTLAGASVARRDGIAHCFSCAPDPHNVIGFLQSSGRLDAASFVQLDRDADVWFRARLIEHLTRTADRVALFPRSDPHALFAQLGVEPAEMERTSATVPEGVDVGLIRRAARRRTAAPTTRRPSDRAEHRDVLAELDAAIPRHRRGRPLVISVGRLHPVKGMDRVAAAWAGDPELRATHNLVIVGGALDDPSPIEASVMAAIDDAVPAEMRDGLVLLGGRPRTDVATLLTAAASGHGSAWSAGGVYVDGALKEEFGLALLEALAAGLVVVAPSIGGPPTFVDDGRTGVLVDPDDDLADGIRHAVELVDLPGRAEDAATMVERRYSIDTMAERLAALYTRRTPARRAS